RGRRHVRGRRRWRDGLGRLGLRHRLRRLLVVLHALGEPVLELLLSLAQVLGELRQLRAAEHEQTDDQEDDELASSENSHAAHSNPMATRGDWRREKFQSLIPRSDRAIWPESG